MKCQLILSVHTPVSLVLAAKLLTLEGLKRVQREVDKMQSFLADFIFLLHIKEPPTPNYIHSHSAALHLDLNYKSTIQNV